MCGNGARVSALIADMAELVDMNDGKVFELDTRSGIKYIVRTRPEEYTVDMGVWQADESRNFSVTVQTSDGAGSGGFGGAGGGGALVATRKTITGRFVDVGNEHIVSDLINESNISSGVRLRNLDLGVKPEFSPLTLSDSAARVRESQANFEFTEVDIQTKTIDMRVYERGVKETLSCGTGICASAISAYVALRDKVPNVDRWRVIVPGGSARVRILGDHVLLTGSAMVTAKITLNENFSRGLLYANA
jgi:diaminopimelate epimerase